MSILILIVSVALVLSLLTSALMLWLSCLVFRVRRQTPDGPSRIRYRRALVVTLFVTLLSYVTLGITLAVYRTEGVPEWMQFPLEGALLFAAVLVILRNWLPTGWLRSIGILLLWAVLDIGRVFLTVLVLWSLVCEPFLVPTGAMAETILGHHKEIVCPKCGLQFALNASSEADPGAGPPIR